MKMTERLWWVILAESERLMAKENDDIMLYHNVNCQARKALVGYGVNLDNLWPDAKEEFERLVEKQRVKEKAELKNMNDFEALIKRTDALLKRSKSKRSKKIK